MRAEAFAQLGQFADAAWERLRAFHLEASTKAMAHMRLATGNIGRTTWLAGAPVCPDAAVAVRGAPAVAGLVLLQQAHAGVLARCLQ